MQANQKNRDRASSDCERPIDAVVYADRDAEQVFLGALIEGDARALAQLKALARNDFTEERGEILEAVRHHVEHELSVDLILIGGTLANRGRGHLIHELAACWDAFFPYESANVEQYAARIRTLSAVRELQKQAAAAWGWLRDPSLTLDERLDRVFEALPPALARVRNATGDPGGADGGR